MDHITVMPADVKWQDAPPSLPKGAKIAVLEGNLTAPGPFTFRVRVPDGYKVPPHWHPAVEHMTVLQGMFYLGMGDKWDETVAKEYPVGSFSAMPQGMHHFAWTKGETVIQVHGMGPWGITYVNPSDDPRNAPSASKQ
ncbi:MAG: cupin domain-containing protein [Candidatus Latescibacteria bacterium]|nr:cupin domain-containing protein [Candidatus Latescibacterota bacterium]